MTKQKKQRTQEGVLGKLMRLRAALDANAGELAHLDGARVRFANKVVDAQEAAREQAALIATKQESSRRLEGLLVECQRLATGIGRMLKEFYGIGSEKLAEFGLQPFRGRSRRTEPEEPPPPPPEVEVEPAAPDGGSKV